jgi:hypothetical protein
MRVPAVLISTVLVTLIARFGLHEAFGMLLQVGAHLRMVRQVLLEPRMRGEILLIIRQPRIAGEFLCYFRMPVQVAIIESRHWTPLGGMTGAPGKPLGPPGRTVGTAGGTLLPLCAIATTLAFDASLF